MRIQILGLRSRCSLQPRLSHCRLSALELRDCPEPHQTRVPKTKMETARMAVRLFGLMVIESVLHSSIPMKTVVVKSGF